MELVEVQRLTATVRLTLGDLLVLNNVLNEVCHGVELPDFQERIGCERAVVQNFLTVINETTQRVQAAP